MKTQKNSNFITTIIYIYRLSYISIKLKEKVHDFGRWNVLSKRLNFLLNKKIFQQVALSEFTMIGRNMEHQFILDCFIFILSRHYIVRQKTYILSKKFFFFSRQLFICLSILKTILNLFNRFFANVYKGKNKFESYRLDEDAKVSSISIGFPDHAYSVKKSSTYKHSADFQYTSSFGEYIDSNYKLSVHFSIDEYKGGSDLSMNDDLFSLERVKPLEISGVNFISKLFDLVFSLPRLVLLFFRNFHINFIYLLIYEMLKLKSNRYYLFIESLESDVDIYINVSSDIGLLMYDEDLLRSKIKTYCYSSNTLIPPVKHVSLKTLTPNNIDALSDMNILNMRLSGISVGFTDTFKLINGYKKLINKVFSLNLALFKYQNIIQIPMLLGFNRIFSQKTIGYKFIGVFDVPPQESSFQMQRTLLGDMSCDLSIIKEFYKDIFGSIGEEDVLLIKPKYFFSENYVINYAVNIKEYRDIFNSMKDVLQNRMILIDPYTDINTLVSSLDVVINFPYTSTKYVGDYHNKPSKWYFPIKYKQSFNDGYIDKEILFGVDSLKAFISGFRDFSKN